MGDEMVHPLTARDWGVRRLFVPPAGTMGNMIQHRD